LWVAAVILATLLNTGSLHSTWREKVLRLLLSLLKVSFFFV